MSLSRLRSLEDEMKKCFRCSLCKMVPLPVVANPDYSDGCPSARVFHFHGYSGSGKQIMALSLLDGRIEVDTDLAEIVFACTTCGLCDVACKFIMAAERHQVNMALREHIVEQGFTPPILQKKMARLETPGGYPDPAGTFGHHRAKELGLKLLPENRADVLLYPDYRSSGSAAAMATAGKAVSIFRKAGVDFGVLGDKEPSSGLPAYWAGHRALFSRLAAETVTKMKGSGAKTVVVTSGATLGLIRSKYPEYGHRLTEPRVLHITEYIEELMKKGQLKMPRPINKKVTYHDPCYLGRQSEPPVEWQGENRVTHGCMSYTRPPRPINTGAGGVYDAPRNIMRAIKGLSLVEMWRIREYAFCCGGGGGVPDTCPELALSSASHRLSEAVDTGADLLVTACDHCIENFNRCIEKENDRRIPVVNILDLIDQAISGDNNAATGVS